MLFEDLLHYRETGTKKEGIHVGWVLGSGMWQPISDWWVCGLQTPSVRPPFWKLQGGVQRGPTSEHSQEPCHPCALCSPAHLSEAASFLPLPQEPSSENCTLSPSLWGGCLTGQPLTE